MLETILFIWTQLRYNVVKEVNHFSGGRNGLLYFSFLEGKFSKGCKQSGLAEGMLLSTLGIVVCLT